MSAPHRHWFSSEAGFAAPFLPPAPWQDALAPAVFLCTSSLLQPSPLLGGDLLSHKSVPGRVWMFAQQIEMGLAIKPCRDPPRFSSSALAQSLAAVHKAVIRHALLPPQPWSWEAPQA